MLYNIISRTLQVLLCLVLLVGFLSLLKRYSKIKIALVLLLGGSLLLETIDLYTRLSGIYTNNHFNYAISQFLFLVLITEIYAVNFFKMSLYFRKVIHVLAVILFIMNIFLLEAKQHYSTYANVFVSCVLCYYSLCYFSKIIKTGATKKDALLLNVSVFFFFSVEALISLTFNFLISNYLNWVAPIWFFRAVLLIIFYSTLINFGWNLGNNKQ